MEELIKQGAAQEAKDNRGGYTPLHLAADAGQCEVISRLCELGADLEAVSTKGWTPLALANMKVLAPQLDVYAVALQVYGVPTSDHFHRVGPLCEQYCPLDCAFTWMCGICCVCELRRLCWPLNLLSGRAFCVSAHSQISMCKS